MCLAVLLHDSHPDLLLLLAFNRDEFFDRWGLDVVARSITVR